MMVYNRLSRDQVVILSYGLDGLMLTGSCQDSTLTFSFLAARRAKFAPITCSTVFPQQQQKELVPLKKQKLAPLSTSTLLCHVMCHINNLSPAKPSERELLLYC
jgi:hypothetical protein